MRYVSPLTPNDVNSRWLTITLSLFRISDEEFAELMGVVISRVETWKSDDGYITDIEKRAIYYYFKYLNLA